MEDNRPDQTGFVPVMLPANGMLPFPILQLWEFRKNALEEALAEQTRRDTLAQGVSVLHMYLDPRRRLLFPATMLQLTEPVFSELLYQRIQVSYPSSPA